MLRVNQLLVRKLESQHGDHTSQVPSYENFSIFCPAVLVVVVRSDVMRQKARYKNSAQKRAPNTPGTATTGVNSTSLVYCDNDDRGLGA